MTRSTWIVAVGLYAVSSITTFGQDDRFMRPSLRGLTASGVVVEETGQDGERLGLSRATLQTDTELKLRLAGIRVLTRQELLRAPGSPYLHVNVTSTLDSQTENIFAVCIAVELVQGMILERDQSIRVEGITSPTRRSTCSPDRASRARRSRSRATHIRSAAT